MTRIPRNVLTVLGVVAMVIGGGLIGVADTPAMYGIGAACSGLAVGFLGLGTSRARAGSLGSA